MAQTTILSSIQRAGVFPIIESITAPNNCGTLSLILNQNWTEQMIHELPTINVAVYVDTDIKLLSIDVDMTTVCSDKVDLEPIKPYSIPIFDLPESFDFVVTPIFDNNALASHNAQIETGDVSTFNTSGTGIVDTNIDDYSSEYWTTKTTTFILDMVFDDTKISSSGGGGGSSTADNVSFTPPQDMTATDVQAAIEEVDTKVNDVNNKVDSLPEPMIFKGSLGTGGTITTLPVASSDNKGFTYKVITAGTYQGIAANIGDTFISDGTQWVLIPSGDEPSGTVTNVGISSADGSVTITGSPITSSGTIDLSVPVDNVFSNSSAHPVQNKIITELVTPMTQNDYEQIVTKTLPLYFIYEA